MSSMDHDSTRGSELDRRLERLMGAIGPEPGFDDRLMQRIRSEARQESGSNGARAQAVARAQGYYRSALKHVQVTRRRMLQALTLDSLAAAALLMALVSWGMRTFGAGIAAATGAWVDAVAEHGLLVGMVVGMVAALMVAVVVVIAEGAAGYTARWR